MKFSHQLLTGLSFGLTSGVVTTLGLVVGLFAGTHSRTAVVGGILTIALVDSLSDAVGLHVAEESEGVHTTKELWKTAVFTFLAKFSVAMTFLVPILLLPLSVAAAVSIGWGLFLVCVFSFLLAKAMGETPWGAVLEHIAAALVAVLAARCLGNWVATVFG